MSTPLTDQLRAYFVDVDRQQGAVDIDALWRNLDEGVVTVELAPDRPASSNGPSNGRRWLILIAAAAVVLMIVSALVLFARDEVSNPQVPVAPPGDPLAENGLIAFAGNPGDGSGQSDIYVVAPDGSGLRALTSTSELVEYAPTWSPDGSRLAFVRSDLPSGSPPRVCRPHCELVVVDPTTSVETFSADIPSPRDTWGAMRLTVSLAWSPDGRAIVTHSLIGDGYGNRGSDHSLIADLETGEFTTFSRYEVMWSPDGEWLTLVKGASDVPGSSLLLAPADLLGTGDDVDIAELPGVRPLPADAGGGVEWMPDGSAILVAGFVPDAEIIHQGQGEAWIDVVTVADGQRRRLIEDGFGPVVSPDGSQIAYSHERAPAGVTDIWIAAADGSEPRRVTFSSTPPAWSPDGRLLLASDQDGWFTVQPDGSERTQVTPFMLPEANDSCCTENHASWQPLPPGSSIVGD